jgi:hypothetical protein
MLISGINRRETQVTMAMAVEAQYGRRNQNSL